jgi:hypothetical protein
VNDPKREAGATHTQRSLAVGIVTAMMCITLSACGGGGGPAAGSNAGACGKALDSYSADLVASDADGTGPTLTPTEARSHHAEVVENCTEDQFVALIKGYRYDYTKGADAIASNDPKHAYEAFKSNR